MDNIRFKGRREAASERGIRGIKYRALKSQSASIQKGN